MKIGPIVPENNLILAPMAGVTDKPFRNLCRKLGAGLAVSEMVTADTRLWDSRKSRARLDHAGETAPCVVQIAGADPAMLANAARINADRGAAIIDINMGCPAKKVCNVMAGSALLRDETLVGRIIDAVVNSVPVPVTLKIRTGWDATHRNALQVARMAEDGGIQMLTVHGRTRACGFSGPVEHNTVAEIKSRINIPVIANGDICDAQQAERIMQDTGVDGIMIGRAAQGNPWIFREIHHYLETGEQLPLPTPEETRNILSEHLSGLYDLYGEYTGVRVARKHLGWYCKKQKNARDFKNKFNLLEKADQQLELVDRYFFKQKQQLAA